MVGGNKFQSWDDIHYDVFPKQWCLHEFTDEEREILLGGGIVHLPDCRSRVTNGRWECDVYWGKTEGHPHWLQIHPVVESLKLLPADETVKLAPITLPSMSERRV